jgi:RHS repeat-associated protein
MPWSVEKIFSLAAECPVNDQKPHQGVTGKNAGPHQRSTASNSTTALGVSRRLWSGTASGARVSYEYDAFGNEFTVNGSTPNNYLYRGEQYDPDLGLYYLRARYYNPLTGRFMSRDPGADNDVDDDGDPADWEDVGFTDAGGTDLTDPRNLHAYLYAIGDPVNFIDPSGQASAAEDAILIRWGALTLATGSAIVNYEQHKDQVDGALRALGSEISCGYNQLSTEFISWVEYGLAGDTGTVSQAGPCTFTFEEHESGKRKSTEGKHEKGKSRRKGSRGKGTHPKTPPRKRPKGWEGPWNPSKGWKDGQY